jgi:hypothetical protein
VSNLLTISRMKSARGCLRLHKLRYLDGYRPAQEPNETRFGSLVHKGLEAWWLARGSDNAAEPLDAALFAVRAAGEADAFALAKAEVMLIGYDERWGAEAYDVLGVEVEFRGPVRNPATGNESRIWELGGKIDAVVRDRATGQVLVVEHKTSGEDITPGGEYWLRLRMDGQVSVYFEGAKLLGHDVAGCLYDVLGKPGIRPAKATPVEDRKYTKPTKAEPAPRLYANQREYDETAQEYRNRLAREVGENPAKYFQRSVVSRLEVELDEALLDTWQFGQSLRESVRLGRAPRNPDYCVRYGRRCEFFDVCTGVASLQDQTRFIRRENVHPELAGIASAPRSKEETDVHASSSTEPAAEVPHVPGQHREGEAREA